MGLSNEDALDRALAWLKLERERQVNSAEPLELTDSGEWSLTNDRISHHTGRFFDVVGAEWTDARGDLRCAPFVDQPEIGILGFLTTLSNGEPRVLLDAKYEPGNVNEVHAAPSFQATKSNADRVHGGLPPTLSEWFLDESNWSTATLQSEEGTRFLNKWNRNVVVQIDDEIETPVGMSWLTFGEAQVLLRSSHSLNTDARSVFVTADWDVWLGGHVRGSARGATPFRSEPHAQLSRELMKSLAQPVADDLVNVAEGLLDDWQSTHGLAHSIVPLALVDGKVVVQSTGQLAPTSVTHLRVRSDSRERAAWDQPLLATAHPSKEILLCTGSPAGLRFFFAPVAEVGLARAQFGNTISSFDAARDGGLLTSDPGARRLIAESSEIIAIEQSDEGGRFDKQIVEYSIRYTDEPKDVTELTQAGMWLSLAEMHTLLSKQGFFTNEARTAISLVLGLI